MFITPERIAQLAPRVYGSIAAALAEVLEEETAQYGVTTLLRRAHFMGQACWESQYFSRFEENLNYSAPRLAAVFPSLADRADDLAGNPQQIASAIYADKNGNGNEASGDGWRFRGRGIFQMTGRSNYAAAGAGLGLELVDDPDQVSTPDGAVKTALWFWDQRHCSGAADLDDCQRVTRLINGPSLLGLNSRIELTESAKRIFL